MYRLINQQVPRQLNVASLFEQLPDDRHLVTFDPAKVDALGIPKPVLDYGIDPYTEAGLQAAEQAHDKLFDAVGVAYRRHFQTPYGSGHVLGTHRMGTDPKTSVTDANGRTHDHPNLYLAGGGLFPMTGTANPTATVAALALRAAAAMEAELGGLATPVASTAASPLASPVA